MNIDFEPFKPINTSLYLCDNKFHTEALNELLEDDDTFGFIVMDGNGCLYATLQGIIDIINYFIIIIIIIIIIIKEIQELYYISLQ